MSKAKKIIFSVSLLVVLIAVVLALLPASAADAPNLTFKAVKNGETIKSVSAGETFEVEADFSEKFNMFDLNVTYDQNIFELKEENTGVEGTTNMTEKGIYYFNYSTSAVGGKKASDGKVFVLTFEVKSDAEIGKTGKIALNFTTPFKINDDNHIPQAVDYKLVDELKDGLTVTEKQVSNIAVKTKPSKMTYKEGGEEKLDLSGGVITVTYTDKTKKDVDMTDNSVVATGFDSSKPGKNTITLSYGGKTCTLKLTISEKEVESIIIVAPTKTSYYQDSDEVLDLTGGIVKVTYDNGDKAEVSMSDSAVKVTGFNNSKAGTNTCTVTYGGKTGTFDLTILAKAVTGIKVHTLPTKTSYIEGEEKKNLDLKGGKIDITYNNGKTETLNMTDPKVKVTGFSSATVGDNTLTVTYNDGTKDWTCTFDVTITAKGVESISVQSKPTKLTYQEGLENLDLTGGEIKVNYDNGKSEAIAMNATGVSVTGFDNTKVGKQTLTVSYGGKTCTFDVEVVAKAIESIEIKSAPTKTSYYQDSDEKLDFTGGMITVKYNNSQSDDVAMSDSSVKVTGYDNSKAGTNTCTVTYGGKTATFDLTIVAKAVTGIKVNTLPTKTSYIEGEEEKNLDLKGGKIDITYNNGKTETLNMTDSKVTVSGFSTATVGANTLTVTYNDGTKDWTCTFDVTITAKGVESISVQTKPAKLTYQEGLENLNLTGGEIKVDYDNGESGIISMTAEGVSVTGFDNTKVGKQTLNVSYCGKTCTFDVEVVAKAIESIEIKSAPTNQSYIQNNENDKELDLSGGVITVHYDNQTLSEVNMTDEGVSVQGYDFTKAGSQTITVSYGGKTTTFEVNVIEVKVEEAKVEPKEISPEKKAVYEETIQNTQIGEDALEALKEAAQTVVVEEEAINDACKELGINKEDVKVVYEPSFQIELNETASSDPVDGKLQSFTVEITPVVNVKVVDVNDETKAKDLIPEEIQMEDVEIEISIQLPQAFQDAMEEEGVAYVQHEAKSGFYEYVAEVDDNGNATFTSEHGCSPFTLSTKSQASAEVNGTRYINLEDALNAAIESRKEMTLLKDGHHDFTEEEIGEEGIIFTINRNGFAFTYTIPEGYEMKEESIRDDVVKYAAAKKGEEPQPVKPDDLKGNDGNGTQINTGIATHHTSVYIAAALTLMAILTAAAVLLKRRETNDSQE